MYQFKVYTIRDCDDCVRYVGKSNDSANRIWYRHKIAKSPVGKWIREQIALGNPVEVRIEVSFNETVSEHPDMAARVAEQRAIAYYAKQNREKLFNVNQRTSN